MKSRCRDARRRSVGVEQVAAAQGSGAGPVDVQVEAAVAHDHGGRERGQRGDQGRDLDAAPPPGVRQPDRQLSGRHLPHCAATRSAATRSAATSSAGRPRPSGASAASTSRRPASRPRESANASSGASANGRIEGSAAASRASVATISTCRARGPPIAQGDGRRQVPGVENRREQRQRCEPGTTRPTERAFARSRRRAPDLAGGRRRQSGAGADEHQPQCHAHRDGSAGEAGHPQNGRSPRAEPTTPPADDSAGRRRRRVPRRCAAAGGAQVAQPGQP